jgi:hypothetical protein
MTAAAVAAVAIALSPNPSHFGELVTAHVTGPADHVSFAPFTVRSHHGSDYVLQCLDPVCVPGPRAIVVAPKRLHAIVLPRATEAQVQRPLRSFRRQTATPTPTYRIAPSTLRALALALAALAVVFAAVVAWPLARRLVPEPIDDRTALEQALDLVRASLRSGADERRRALDVLARLLGRGKLRDDALALAWSEADPEPERVRALVERVAVR